VRVRQTGEDGRLRWCGFNALLSDQEGRRRDESLLEDEVKAASSSWFHQKEV
jgi:hypothetical protein